MHNLKVYYRPLVSAIHRWPWKSLIYNHLYFCQDLSEHVLCEVSVEEVKLLASR